MKLFFLFLSILIDTPDWFNETDKIVHEIDLSSKNIYKNEVVNGDELSIQNCYAYENYFKTEVIITDSSSSTNLELNYYSKKKKAFAYKFKMDAHFYTKGVQKPDDVNRFYQETLIYFKSKNEGIKLEQSFYYNDQISNDSLINLKKRIEFTSNEVERKEIEKIIKNLKRIKHKCY